jgi:hypothetical protein
MTTEGRNHGRLTTAPDATEPEQLNELLNSGTTRDPAVDKQYPGSEDYQTLLLDDLVYFFPGPCAMLSAYLDESGLKTKTMTLCRSRLVRSSGSVGKLCEEKRPM